MNYVKTLLKEIQAQAPEGSELGLYAFAMLRKYKNEPDLPAEEDTQIEKELFQAIKLHVYRNVNLPPKYTALIKKFIENGWYGKVIKPPPAGTTIYRGQGISLKRLKRILGLTRKDNPELIGKADVNFVWKHPLGDGYGSSWTKKSYMADSFSRRDNDPKRPVSVVFTAAPGQEKNFLDLTPTEGEQSGLYRFLSGYEKEGECISLESINVSQISWDMSEERKSPNRGYDDY